MSRLNIFHLIWDCYYNMDFEDNRKLPKGVAVNMKTKISIIILVLNFIISSNYTGDLVYALDNNKVHKIAFCGFNNVADSYYNIKFCEQLIELFPGYEILPFEECINIIKREGYFEDFEKYFKNEEVISNLNVPDDIKEFVSLLIQRLKADAILLGSVEFKTIERESSLSFCAGCTQYSITMKGYLHLYAADGSELWSENDESETWEKIEDIGVKESTFELVKMNEGNLFADIEYTLLHLFPDITGEQPYKKNINPYPIKLPLITFSNNKFNVDLRSKSDCRLELMNEKMEIIKNIYADKPWGGLEYYKRIAFELNDFDKQNKYYFRIIEEWNGKVFSTSPSYCLINY